MSQWSDCIVSLIDLVGISKKLHESSQVSVNKMRDMHQEVYKISSDKMPLHDYVYCWNDSVLLLALDYEKADYQAVMQEVNRMKIAIDKICSSYVISVKGKTFPKPRIDQTKYSTEYSSAHTEVVYIRASSLAFANCFLIEKALGSKKKQWYLDKRIAIELNTIRPTTIKLVTLFPHNTKREIYMYKGYLWDNC